jgi:hypothetical protein
MFDAPLHTALALAAAAALTLTGVWSALPWSQPDAPATAPDVPTEQVHFTLEIDPAEVPAWTELTPEEWRERADQLHARWVEAEARPDGDAHLQTRIQLAAEWGRSAENANDPSPPHYGPSPEGEAPTVNLGFWHAARLAQDADRADLVRALGPIATSIRFYQAQRAGEPQPFAVHRARTALERWSSTPWNSLSEEDWREVAWTLRDHAIDLWPNMRRTGEHEALMVALLAQLGRAAENTNQPAPPFYRTENGVASNWYWMLAARLIAEEPELAEALSDAQVRRAVEAYVGKLEWGEVEMPELPNRID